MSIPEPLIEMEWFYTSADLTFQVDEPESEQNPCDNFTLTSDLSVDAFEGQLSIHFCLTDQNIPSEVKGHKGQIQNSQENELKLRVSKEVAARWQTKSVQVNECEYIERLRWKTCGVQFQFCLVKLNFYHCRQNQEDKDNNSNVALVKYLHLDQMLRKADCGCDIYDLFSCYKYNECKKFPVQNDQDPYHYMMVSQDFPCFCSRHQLEPLVVDLPIIIMQVKPSENSVEENEDDDEPSMKKQKIPNQQTKGIYAHAEFIFARNLAKPGSAKLAENEKDKKTDNEIQPFKNEISENQSTEKEEEEELITFKFIGTGAETETREIIQVPKNILMRSEMLKRMLESPMAESLSKEILVLTNFIKHAELQDFLDGLAGAWTICHMEENHLNFPLLLQRLKICDYYQATELTDLILKMLIGNPNSMISLDHALDFYTAGCRYNSPCLRQRALQYLTWNKDKIIKDKEAKNVMQHFLIQKLTNENQDEAFFNEFLQVDL